MTDTPQGPHVVGFGHQVSGPPVGVLPAGPVWHASVSGTILPAVLEREARRQLAGVGDADRGEWAEFNPRARVFHLRRRLTVAEERVTGPAVDIRGTPEAAERIRRIPAALLADVPAGILAEELGGQAR